MTEALRIPTAAVSVWEQAGIGIPTKYWAYEPYTPNDTEVWASSGCCNGECTCLGEYDGVDSTDNCSVALYRGNSNWTQNPRTVDGYDYQAVLSHEFGHCLGLDHEDDVDALMNSGYDGHPDGIDNRFLRKDDMLGVRSVQGHASWSLYWRNPGDSSWNSSFNGSSLWASGSPGVAYGGGFNGWNLIGFQSSSGLDWVTTIGKAGPTPSSWTNVCGIWHDNTWQTSRDGVAVGRDVGGTNYMAVAYLYKTNGYIRAVRNLYPVAGGCGSFALMNQLTDTDFITRRRPALTYNANNSRLTMAWIDYHTGLIKISTNSSTNNSTWVSGGGQYYNTSEYTDAPVGIVCGYWSPTASTKCFIAFPRLEGDHYLRLCRLTPYSNGGFSKDWCSNSSYAISNVPPSIRIANDNTVEIMVPYFSTGSSAPIRKYTYTESGGWSQYSSYGSTKVGMAIGGGVEIKVGN
ncbi:MAG: matrixin family metalloprotease [Candidatus Kerfeldbacteria bacterium]|nr:matrixin family metalloprotease [Candidatus Kerfeldbacteria bacterium]